ncbi:MAG: hypothetical protein DLM55_05545 [Acidimicrobiales bacterium]|nr:MAG: hypothetical protein DLM55_05545 [Acidimicrobiales bacterium]
MRVRLAGKAFGPDGVALAGAAAIRALSLHELNPAARAAAADWALELLPDDDARAATVLTAYNGVLFEPEKLRELKYVIGLLSNSAGRASIHNYEAQRAGVSLEEPPEVPPSGQASSASSPTTPPATASPTGRPPSPPRTPKKRGR